MVTGFRGGAVPSESLAFLRADRATREQHPRYRASVVWVAVMGAAASSFTGALLFGSLPTRRRTPVGSSPFAP